MNIANLVLDVNAVQNGTNFTYPGTDVQVYIARFDNSALQAAVQQKRTALGLGPTENLDLDGKWKKEFAEIIASFLWRGTKNLTEGEGDGAVEVGTTHESRVELLLDPRLRDFVDWIFVKSQTMSAFREESIRKSMGNSPR